MARSRNKGKSGSRLTPVQGQRKRSLTGPLVIAGMAAVVAFPMIRDATGEKMTRERYGADHYSCQCDYGSQCQHVDDNWVGPWRPADQSSGLSLKREWGECSQDSDDDHYRHGGYYGAGRPVSAYRFPPSREIGYRGGFGGTAWVRSAGS